MILQSSFISSRFVTKRQTHGNSEAVRRFEDAYQPVLVGGPVVFTDYRLVASNQRT